MQHQRLQGQDHRKHGTKKHGALYIQQQGNAGQHQLSIRKRWEAVQLMANQNTMSSYLNEDIFQYKDNVDDQKNCWCLKRLTFSYLPMDE